MPLTAEEQALFDHAKNSLPRWLTSSSVSALEWLHAFAKMFGAVLAQGQEWLDITYLDNAEGAELDQHAIDRGTTRRVGESDESLRERIRQITDAVTEPALTAGVDRILDGQGFLARLHVAHHTTSGWNTVFEANDSFAAGGFQTALTLSMVDDGTNPPVLIQDSQQPASTILFDAGVTTRGAIDTLIGVGGNFSVLTLSASPASVLVAGDAFTNAPFMLSGFVSVRRDRAHFHIPTESTGFMSRGYRMGNAGRPMSYIVILPFGTTSAMAAAVQEYLRQYGPAGYNAIVERRMIP